MNEIPFLLSTLILHSIFLKVFYNCNTYHGYAGQNVFSKYCISEMLRCAPLSKVWDNFKEKNSIQE
jgi:hypothetical protein